MLVRAGGAVAIPSRVETSHDGVTMNCELWGRSGDRGPALIYSPSQPVRQVTPAVALVLIASVSRRFGHEVCCSN
jgi:hypothetical protein